MYNKVSEEERKAILEMVKKEIAMGLAANSIRQLCIDDVKEDFSEFGKTYYTEHIGLVIELMCDYYIDLKTKEVYKKDNT